MLSLVRCLKDQDGGQCPTGEGEGEIGSRADGLVLALFAGELSRAAIVSEINAADEPQGGLLVVP
jgi:hypothetical protein